MNRYDIALGKKPVPKPAAVVVPILRGSPEISSNRTSYVDLNQIATGDGSEGNPLNYAQFNSGAISTTTVRLRGSLSTSTGPISISAPVTSTSQTYSISLTEGNLGRYHGIGFGDNPAGITRIRTEP